MTLGAIHQTQIELVATGMAVGETCGVVVRQHAAGEWCKKQLFPVERLLAVGVAGAQCPCWSGGVAHTELVNVDVAPAKAGRSEEHTSELQSLMRISYAVFCLKQKTTTN